MPLKNYLYNIFVEIGSKKFLASKEIVMMEVQLEDINDTEDINNAHESQDTKHMQLASIIIIMLKSMQNIKVRWAI